MDFVDFTGLRVIFAGLVGAATMVVATWIFHAVGLPMVDFGRLLATKILRYHSHGTQLGLVLHLVNGAALALIYAMFVARWLPGPDLLRGVIYGIGLWLIMMLGAFPLLGDGFFGSRTAPGTVPSSLIVHILYGAVIGLAVGS
jgi:hypothetical protein